MACKRNFLISREKRKKKIPSPLGMESTSPASQGFAYPLSHPDAGCKYGLIFVLIFFDVNTGVFPGKMCSDRCKNHGCEQKKTEGTSSASFGVRAAAKCCELKRCADRVRSRTQELNI